MNIKRAEAMANNFKKKDKRLSYERSLTEAVLREVIIDLDTKGKIPSKYLTD